MHHFYSFHPVLHCYIAFTPPRLEYAVETSREKYLLNLNSILINDLDRAIMNCLQATHNMEKFLSIAPVGVDGVSSSEIFQTQNNLGENFIAESSSSTDPAATATVTATTDDLPSLESTDETPTHRDFSIDAGLDVIDDGFTKEDAAASKAAIRRLHISKIYPLKKLELLKNQLEREELLKSTPEYYDYMENQTELLTLFEDVGLNAAERNVISVQKASVAEVFLSSLLYLFPIQLN